MPILFFIRQTWKYRNELILAAQVLAKLRKNAQEYARDYIKKRMRDQLVRQIVIVSFEAALLLAAHWVTKDDPSLVNRLFSSSVLWAITLYNLFHLFLFTIPEIKSVYRAIRGKTGFALKYFLGVSVVTELMEMEIVFLAICVVLALSGRGAAMHGFSYLEPWRQLLAGAPL